MSRPTRAYARAPQAIAVHLLRGTVKRGEPMGLTICGRNADAPGWTSCAPPHPNFACCNCLRMQGTTADGVEFVR